MPSYRSEPYELSKETLQEWIFETVMQGVGYISVSNYGSCYAKVEHGIYTVEKNGHVEQRRTDRKRQLEIFKSLIGRYHNFERQGYSYHYHRGTWRRSKLKTS